MPAEMQLSLVKRVKSFFVYVTREYGISHIPTETGGARPAKRHKNNFLIQTLLPDPRKSRTSELYSILSVQLSTEI